MRPVVGSFHCVAIAFSALLVVPDARSEAAPTAAELAAQIEAVKAEHARRIKALEARLARLKEGSGTPPATASAFNPAIGVTLDGRVSRFSADNSEVPGFQFGHEGERGSEGLSLGHTELSLSSNVDDHFHGNVSLGFHSHGGEADEIELEEAYMQTLPGAGLPDGMRIKAGRALWTFGYLNEQHAHGDDFADRPLLYRAYLDNHYNDDGIEVSWVLPTEMYGEIGGGIFRGDDLPFGGSDDGIGAWSAFARFGGDLGRDSAWRIGVYALSGEARGRGGAHAHDHGHDGEEEDHGNHEDEDHAHEDEDEGHAHEDEDEDHAHDHDHAFSDADFFSSGMFSGDSAIQGIDFRYTWAPTGNARSSELILQGEFFRRQEEGEYRREEGEDSMNVDSTSTGWYAQAVYKFLPRWRVGARYAQLRPHKEAGIDHNPHAIAVMGDWTNSHFGRLRLQYNRETLESGNRDHQFILQYIMSLGAHPAHAF